MLTERLTEMGSETVSVSVSDSVSVSGQKAAKRCSDALLEGVQQVASILAEFLTQCSRCSPTDIRLVLWCDPRGSAAGRAHLG